MQLQSSWSSADNLGADSEALRFVSRDAAMIIRMRGLPFQTTEQQIREFFAASSDEEQGDSGIVENEGILFVNRPDGRPSGDAFVLFSNKNAGRRALAKHKHRIGTRYVELFRTTQAEVQQLFNRTLKSPQQLLNSTIMSNNAPKRDCVRLRGLPYEAQVQQVVDFLGVYSHSIVFQGVHMIYNNKGHPSGEAFIQMDTEISAASAAQAMHNKYMELGKKKRYIEVFQCSPEDINLLLSTTVVQQQNTGIIPGALMTFNGAQTGFYPLQNFSQFFPQISQQNGHALPPPPPQIVNTNTIPSNLVYATNPLANTPNSTLSLTAVPNAAGNFCLPTLTVPPPLTTSVSSNGNGVTFATADQLHSGQYQQMQFSPNDMNNSAVQAVNAAAFLNLQQQQQQQQAVTINGKNITSFFPPPIVTLPGNALPTCLATQLQLGGGFAGALPYQFSFPASIPQFGLKLDANNNTGLVDYQRLRPQQMQ